MFSREQRDGIVVISGGEALAAVKEFAFAVFRFLGARIRERAGLERLGEFFGGAGDVFEIGRADVEDRAEDDGPGAVFDFDDGGQRRNFLAVGGQAKRDVFFTAFALSEFQVGVRDGVEGRLDGQECPLSFAGVDELKEIGGDVAYFQFL